MADEKSGEVIRLIKFDGEESNWHEWSVKTLSLSKIKGFRLVYASDTKPCSDTTYATYATDAEKKIYEANDKAYQQLIMSCTGIAFGLVTQAKTAQLIDGDAFLALKNLCDRGYAPHETSDLIQLSGEFSKCNLESTTKSDPDEWFIKLDMIHNRMTQINSSFPEQDIEVIAHIIDKFPSEYSNKIRAFYKRKFKTENSSTNEIALFAGGKFKGLCRNCGTQGHKSADCRSKGSKADGEKTGKGIKCFNCNKFAGHIAKDCPDEKKKKTADKKETSFFVGCAVEAEEEEEEIHRFGFISDNNNNNNNNNNFEYCASCGGEERWLADTGATSHITSSELGMTNVEKVKVRVIVGDGKEVLCTKRGDVLVTSSNGKTLHLKKVLYTPLFHKNIVTIGVFVQKSDYEVSIKGQTLSLSKTNELENIEFKSEGKELLYYFEGTRDLGTIETVMTSTTTTQPPVIIPAKQIKIDINKAHD